MSSPRILVCGSWDTGPGYPRSRSLIAALQDLDVDVDECHIELPCSGAKKRYLIGRPWLWPQTACRLVAARRTCLSRLQELLLERRPDAVIVPYPGHLAVQWVRSMFAGPVLLDLFLSAYDTVVLDRQRFRPRSMVARWLRRLDRRACESATLTLLDTPHHAEHVAELVGLPNERFDWVPITDPDAVSVPTPYSAPRVGDRLEVLFFGTGVPLHGLSHLIQAVRLAEGVRLTLVGGSRAERELAGQLGSDRLRLLPEFVDRDWIAREIERCHVVAGIFGGSGKARRVVPFKVVHGLAGARPVLTADTPAIRRFLSPAVDCIVCPPADPLALVSVLAELRAHPQRLAGVAAAGRATFEAKFSSSAVAERLSAALGRLGVPVARSSRASLQPVVATV